MKKIYLKDLHSLYVKALNEIDSSSINRTRLEEKILANLPELTCSKRGKEVVFYKPDVADNLIKANNFTIFGSMKRENICSLFKLRPMESIPPTQNALIEHIKSPIFQVSFIWCRSSKKILSIPNPIQYGWTNTSGGTNMVKREAKELAKTKTRQIRDRLHVQHFTRSLRSIQFAKNSSVFIKMATKIYKKIWNTNSTRIKIRVKRFWSYPDSWRAPS